MGNEIFLTVEQVAQRLNVAKSTVYGWIRVGKLRARTIGGRLVRITQSDLDSFVEAGDVEPVSDEQLGTAIELELRDQIKSVIAEMRGEEGKASGE